MMKKFTGIVLAVVLLTALALADENPANMLFMDPTQPIEKRVDDLVSRLTLEEKVWQMMYTARAIPRLGIPEYNWWSEALHGVGRAGEATVFPQAIGMGATFDPDLLYRVATAISDEARAKYAVASAAGNRAQYQGLTFWSPNINIFRDPRWGRGQETYGEDPFLTSQMGVAFIKGLQGYHPKYLKVAACAKHYAVHSGPEGLRHEFNAVVNNRDLWDTYLPAFEAAVKQGKVEAVMGAYNRTNDEPCCASKLLMKDILFGKWGFTGHYVSDCWALVDFHEGHKVTKTSEESAAMALNMGVDLNCGSTYPFLINAVAQGLTDEETIDKNLKELLTTRFKLGVFDPPAMNPYNAISVDVINSPTHRKLARQAATKTFVLLKNKNNTLPLRKDLPNVYVIGPLATDIQAMLGNYYGLNPQIATVLEGVMSKVSKATAVTYNQGALLDRENPNTIDWYSGNASGADATIAVVGINGLIEGEEGESIASYHQGDRADIDLPKNQVDLLKKLRNAAGDKKLVVVVMGGSPLALGEVMELADAVLFAWYPGEEGGNAVADVLFGDVAPSGKLPLTFPKSVKQLPPYEDYNMKGRTYRYMTEEPLFPFGFGLSYTQFAYSDLKLDKAAVKNGETVTASVTVTNKGACAAEEVVQLYITDVQASVTAPQYALKGFKRIALAAGESKTVAFAVTPELMSIVNDNGDKIIEAGDFKVTVGGCSPGQRGVELGAAPAVTAVFAVK